MNRIERTEQLIRDRFDGNRAAFARAINRSANLVWQYLNEHRTMGEKFARHVEKSLRLPEGWLDQPGGVSEGGPARYDNEHELQMAGRFEPWDSNSPDDGEEIEVPLFREVELAAGAGRTEVIENHGAKLKFARSSLRRAGVPEECAACAYVSGDSMEPMLPDGATVGVNTADTQIRDGKLYALDHDGMLRIKQLQRIPGGGLRLVSFNKALHPEEEYSPEQVAEQIRIIGRVFWSATFW